ncbi:c6 transcription factor [Colletotrichum tabaci]|uniref:C6 transcription factor n=1 Tax=Colletotrichum tabaci TaxID=1209068 RepID=A0AAV9T809_9PEZI
MREALRNQGEQQTNRTTATPSSTPNTLPALEDDSTLHQFIWDELPVSYEGGSSFSQQTLLANQIEELKIEDAQTPGVVEELATLRGIYQRHDEWSDQRPKRKTRRPNACPQPLLQLPPSDFVIRLLRTVTEHSVLFLFYAVENRKQVEDLCRRVYFSVEPVTVGEITLLHGYLSVLFKDIDFEARPEFNREETDRYYKLCDANFKAGVETYEVMAVPSFEHTLILFIAALRAQQDENSPLQWSVVSAAARHVLALGYNRKARLDAMPPHESPRARRLFWHIYFVDRGFTLSQGKAPIIQDMDVDVDPLEISQRPHRRPWDMVFSAFIELSRIQLRIYEKLYSPSASRASDEERRSVVGCLSSMLSQWYVVWRNIDYTHACRQDLFEFSLAAIDVVYYSILTLTHRGASSSNSASDITPQCFEAARKELIAHTTAYPRFSSGGYASSFSYSIWTHLFSSFTPYIITFIHCVGHVNTEDLGLLRTALEISERLSGLAESCKRQHELYRALYRIAEAYLKAKKALPYGDLTLETATHLPLQQPNTDNWSCFDSNIEPNSFPELHVEDWNGSYMGQMPFTLDTQAGKGGQ